VAGTGRQIFAREFPDASQQGDEEVAVRLVLVLEEARREHRQSTESAGRRDEPLRRRRQYRRLARIPGWIERAALSPDGAERCPRDCAIARSTGRQTHPQAMVADPVLEIERASEQGTAGVEGKGEPGTHPAASKRAAELHRAY
jgi:hypothetical protein